jgi:DUF4097 and DUF4098 domain-containing protein YvlB
MKIISNVRYYLLLVILLTVSAVCFGQEKEKSRNYEFCSDNWNWSNGDKVSARDLRETTFAAPGTLNVDAGKNGGISVRGENRSDVLVRACIQAWGANQEEANSIVKSIRVETGSTVRADSSTGSDNWSVSYQILVPRAMNVDLKAHNGGISLSSIEGNLKFETTNGGVKLSDLAGDVRGRTTNGGVKVELSGAAWRGSGLDVETTNGGVKLSMPQNYAASVETGTVNGGFKSDIAALNLPEDTSENKWNRKKRISASINGGGAPIRIITTNGGIKIDSAN